MSDCGHFSLDYVGNCMRCARDDEIRAAMAKAWDEGFMDAAGQDHPAYPRTRRIDNPYLRADAPPQPRD